jgi:serine/threonine protein kinase/Tol biopolymer transport system component
LALTAGTRLGAYEVTAQIGSGGMGEVYRATDTNLKRQVAIKVLPDAVATDSERLARFQREAEVLASLSHPNIAAIYGLERADGQTALVMELVEGPTLADRIAQGPLSVVDSLEIATQIAGALEAAHDQGIIHRDLKPANVKITPAGTVKVLDFGLAKAMEPTGVMSSSVSISPTITSPAHLREGYGGQARTQAGMILGTAAYMAPEQARGKTVDRRADIWAFGVVVFEMLTGRRPFGGDDISMTLAFVMTKEPEWAALPSVTPSGLRRLLRWCLDKDPKRRLQAIGDARVQIEELLSGAPEDVSAPARSGPAPLWPRALPWAIAAGVVAAASLLVTLGAAWRVPATAEQLLMELEITPPEGTSFGPVGTRHSAVVSPDGRQVVLVALAKDGTRMLWLRPLASASPRPLLGTENAINPFWSPDGRSVSFTAGGKLKKMSVDSGQPQIIADSSGGISIGTSNAGGVTLFSDSGKPIQRVSAAGGVPSPVFEFDASRGETAHNGPQFLPDGNHFLYMSIARETGVVFASLDGKTRRFLFAQSGSPVSYAPDPEGRTGWLLYADGGQLFARPFDPAKGDLTGDPVRIADSVQGGPTFSVSNTGILMFRHIHPSQTQLTWFARNGTPAGIVGEAGTLGRPRISPDQRTVAFSRTTDGNSDVWLLDLARNSTRKFTLEPGADGNPVWSGNGLHLFYSSRRQNEFLLVERPANGLGEERIVTQGRSGAAPTPFAASRDGQWLVLSEGGAPLDNGQSPLWAGSSPCGVPTARRSSTFPRRAHSWPCPSSPEKTPSG